MSSIVQIRILTHDANSICHRELIFVRPINDEKGVVFFSSTARPAISSLSYTLENTEAVTIQALWSKAWMRGVVQRDHPRLRPLLAWDEQVKALSHM